jgi:mannose-6-phosphate isomerase-like protein (cupin superfamily)
MRIGDWIFMVIVLIIFLRFIYLTLKTYIILLKEEVIYKINNKIHLIGALLALIGLYLIIRYYILYQGNDYSIRKIVYGAAFILLAVSLYDYSVITRNGIVVIGNLINWRDIKAWRWDGKALSKYIDIEFSKGNETKDKLKTHTRGIPISPKRVDEVDKVFKKYMYSNYREVEEGKNKIKDMLKGIKDYCNPKIIGELNESYVKVVKLEGESLWHTHENEDKMFYVLYGLLTIKLRDKDIILDEGEFYIVPKGVEHMTAVEIETHTMIIEPKTIVNTGSIRREEDVTDR